MNFEETKRNTLETLQTDEKPAPKNNVTNFSKLQQFWADASNLEISRDDLNVYLENFKAPFSDPSKYEEHEITKAYEALKMDFSNKVSKKKWKNEEKLLLIWGVYSLTKMNKYKSFSQMAEDNWKFLCELLKKKTYVDCLFKFQSLLLCNYQNKEWTKEEDLLLSEIVKEKIGKESKIKWNEIAKEYFMKSKKNHIFRNEKVCREHWIYSLDPKLKKTSWTEEEDITLMKEFLIQKKKWNKITKSLPGRSCYSIKNRFDILLRKYDIKEKIHDLPLAIERILRKITNPQASDSKVPNTSIENVEQKIPGLLPRPDFHQEILHQKILFENMMMAAASSLYGMNPFAFPPYGFMWPNK